MGTPLLNLTTITYLRGTQLTAVLNTPNSDNIFDKIELNPTTSNDLLVNENASDAKPIPVPAIIDQVSFSSYQTYLTHLCNNIGSRVFPSDGNMEAAEFIADQFELAGLEVMFHEFISGGPNVVGILPSGSVLNNQCIVVGAHFDTIPGSSDGADDNGSGVAAVLEIARVLSQYQYNYTFYFVAFNAEEIGLHGSQAFAQYLQNKSIPVACVYNFDMILWDNPEAPANAKYEIIHNGGASEAIALHAANIGIENGFPVIASYGPGMWMSDQASFWDYGYPGVWFFESAGLTNPWIHSAADTLSRPEYSIELGVIATKNAAAALADFAKPVSTATGFPHASFVSPTPIDFVPPKANIPLVIEIKDAYNDVNHVELSINDEPLIDISSGLNATHCTYLWNATNYYGTTNIHARIYDAVGWCTSTSHTLLIDKGLRLDITSPQPGEQISQGTQYTIWINASDLDSPQLAYVLVNVNNTEWEYAIQQTHNQRYYYNWTVTGGGPLSIQVRARDSNGFTNTSIVEVYVIRYPPVIEEVTIWPNQPQHTDLVQISARIIRNPLGAEIYTILVVYSVDNGSWKTRRLLPSEEDIFMEMIGPFPIGSSIRFYIEAQDWNNNVVQDTRDELYYRFVVTANPTNYILIGSLSVITSIVIMSGFVIWRRKRKQTEGI